MVYLPLGRTLHLPLRRLQGTESLSRPKYMRMYRSLKKESELLIMRNDPDHRDHTYLHPFCSDPTCPDKEDPDAITDLNDMVQEGLMTPEEATNIHRGGLSNYGW